MKKTLDGIRALDLSQFLSGPRTGQILSMLGADVVKVESPAGDTMRLLMAMTASDRNMHTLHHGKRGIVIDLTKPGGSELILNLSRKADILIENFAPGVMKKLGIDYPKVAQVNPQIIYASITGFGLTGPLSDRLAFDLIAQATGGTMYANHQSDRPPGVFFGDLCSGAYAAIGILAALWDREKAGKGKWVDISMQDVMYFHNFWAFAERATEPDREKIRSILGDNMQTLLSDPDNPMPFWNSYKAKDGYIAVVALTDRMWQAMMEIIGRPELGTDPRFATFTDRIRNAKEAIGVVTEWTAQRTIKELIEVFSSRRIPCGPVNDYDALNSDPQLQSRGMLATTFHPKYGTLHLPGLPIQFAGETPSEIKPGPELGEHTDLILTDWLGMGADEISALRQNGIVM